MHGLLNSIGVNIPNFGVKRALYEVFQYPIVQDGKGEINWWQYCILILELLFVLFTLEYNKK